MTRRMFLTSTAVSAGPSRAASGGSIPPAVFLPHGDRQFIGPAVFESRGGELWMLAPFGRPPVDFREIPAFDHLPHLYRSRDRGRTWVRGERLNLSWTVGGYISDGGITLIRLKDRRLMLTFHRHVPGFHGGGIPAISFSADEGRTWSPARLVAREERVAYVMNERTIQLRSGRLLIPVAFRPNTDGAYREGDVCEAACYLSDDEGETWRLSGSVRLNDERGMAEPAVAETGTGRLAMLARTGSGSHHASYSSDRGETWSPPQPTSLVAACSPLTLKTMPDRRLIVVYNPAPPLFRGSFFPRRPLAYSISANEGATWTAPVTIDDAPSRQMIYPSITFLKEGILFVYSEHFARDDGKFSGKDPSVTRLGGGRRRLMPYPQ